MSQVRINRRMYLTADRRRAVPEGDPDAAYLLCPAGGEVSRADAERYGLLEDDKAADEGGQKARQSAPNKMRRPAAGKGGQAKGDQDG